MHAAAATLSVGRERPGTATFGPGRGSQEVAKVSLELAEQSWDEPLEERLGWCGHEAAGVGSSRFGPGDARRIAHWVDH